ncbi:MAG: trimethylamine methyltransferase family protein [Actinobacteria bacterium]|nr:trimethylamine methyltransferase family protein [Actinomycetota bacterium]
MKLSEVKVLNDDEIKRIDEATLDILSEVGVKIEDTDVLSMLEEKGLEINYDTRTIKFNPTVVKKAIEDTPEEFEVFSRDGSCSFKLGAGNETRTASGCNGIFSLDPYKNARKPSTKEDVGIFAKLSNYLSEIDMVSPQSMPQDVPPKSSILHGIDAVFNNTIKPILFAPEKDTEVEVIIEIIKIVLDYDNINIRPIGICEISPSSPLFWTPGTIKGFIKMVKEGFPCLILPGPLSGATAPYSIAGTLIQKNAEILSGVVIAQLFNKGTPLLYCSSAGQIEMKSGAALLSTPECFLMGIASAQIAQYYKIPTHNCTPVSDAHILDEQLGFENMLSYISSFQSGINLLVNAGMFSTGETVSFSQLLIDNEIIGMVRRYMKGIEVSIESLAMNSIKKIRSTGNYMLDELSIKNLRSSEYYSSGILNRKKYQRWFEDGAKNIGENATREVERILKVRQDATLEENKRKKIKKVIGDYENRYK